MKTNSIYRLFFSICLCLCAMAGVLYLYVEMNKKIDTIKISYELEKQNSNLEFGKQLDVQIEDLSKYKQAILKTFIDQENLIYFIQTVENVAKNLDLDFAIEKVDRKPVEIISNSYKVQDAFFYLNINGSYEQIRYFLEILSQFEQRILIEEFKIYKNRSEDEVVYNARVTILTKILEYDKK